MVRLGRSVVVFSGVCVGLAGGLGACDGDDDAVAPVVKTTDAGLVDSAVVSMDAVATVDAAGDFTAAEEAALRALGPLPSTPPADPTNNYADDPKAAALGQMLYFDKSYSGAIVLGSDGANGGLGAAGDVGKVSCASCHGGTGLDDARSKPSNLSIGINRGTRNALAVANASFYTWTNWGGRFDSQWSLSPAVAENPRNMASTRLTIAHMMWNKYRAEYNALFPVALDAALDPAAADAARFPASGKPKAAATDPDGAWELMTAADRTIVNTIFANYGKAIQAYMRKLVTTGSAFDTYMAGDTRALSAEAKRGAKLFVGKAGCISCHSGAFLTDNKFHALGVGQTGPNVPATDFGRFADVPALLSSPFNSNGAFSDNTTTGRLTGLASDESQRGQFRTPTLRNVSRTAPYMHAGQFATLEEVISFYASGGGTPADGGGVKDPGLRAFALVGTDTADLVAFLRSFEAPTLAATLLTDTSKP